MINNLLKIGTLVVTGRFLKPRFKGLLCLVLFWLSVRLLHGEYISYVELSDDTSFLWQASLLKIALYIFAGFAYLALIERNILLNSKVKVEKKESGLNTDGQDDGFNFLRKKKKLNNKSEQLLDK